MVVITALIAYSAFSSSALSNIGDLNATNVTIRGQVFNITEGSQWIHTGDLNLSSGSLNITSGVVRVGWRLGATFPLVNISNDGRVSALNFTGNLTWTDLYTYPVACPDGSFVTNISDSTTCTVLDHVVGNFSMTRNATVNGTFTIFNPPLTTISRSEIIHRLDTFPNSEVVFNNGLMEIDFLVKGNGTTDTLYVKSRNNTVHFGGNISIGNDDNNNDVILRWEAADVDANMFHVILPENLGANIPILAIGDASILGTDQGPGPAGLTFSAVTAPTILLFGDDPALLMAFSHSGTQAEFVTNDGPFAFSGIGGSTTEIKLQAAVATENPKLSFYQTTTEMGYIQYLDVDDSLKLDSDGRLNLASNNRVQLSLRDQLMIFNNSVATSGANTGYHFTEGNYSGITAATERIGMDFNMSSTKTWAAGAGPLATQREVIFRAPTYDSDVGGALTITDSATVAITGAPIDAGANIVLSRLWALWLQGGNMRLEDGLIDFAGTTGGGSSSSRYQIYRTGTPSFLFQVPTSTNFVFNGGVNSLLTMSDSSGTTFNEDGIDVDFRIEGDTVTRVIHVDAVSDGMGIRRNGNETAGLIIGGPFTGIERSLLTTDNITHTASAAQNMQRFVNLQRPLIAGGFTVTNASTFYIQNAPNVTGGGTAITNNYSMWVDDGESRFDNYIVFDDSGIAPTAAKYQIGRDAQATNMIHFNTPTNTGYNFTMNNEPNVHISRDTIRKQTSTAGQAAIIGVLNTDNTNGNSNALVQMVVGGASGGDPYLLFNNGVNSDWAIGLDNSFGDDLAISRSSTVGSLNILNVTFSGGNWKLMSLPSESGSPVSFDFRPGAHGDVGVGLQLANAEAVDVLFSLGRHVNFTGGAIGSNISTQRAMVINAPKYSSMGNLNITNATTLFIAGAPWAETGTNITNKYALYVNDSNAYFGGNVTVSGYLKYTLQTQSITSNKNLTNDDAGIIRLVGAGGYNATLPLSTLSPGVIFNFVRVGGAVAAFGVNVSNEVADSISGNENITFEAVNEAVTIASDGVTWKVTSWYRPGRG